MRAILFLIAALLATETLAWWWMNPPRKADPARLIWQPANPNPQDKDAATITPLPDLVARFKPQLHCTSGNAMLYESPDGISVHMGFFEWDSADDSANILEAFKHPPEACLGYIGMTIVKAHPTRIYPIAGDTIPFDATTFRDSRGFLVHSFKGVWFSGAENLPARGLHARGEAFQRIIRWQAAKERFRPTRACVIQGAVRGASSADEAWAIFQNAMLKNLRRESL